MPYDITQFSPEYGGTINSSGNVVNMADAFDSATSSLKIETVPVTNLSALLTLQNAATGLGDGTVIDVGGYAALSLQITITGTATVTFEVSTDGTNYNVTSGKFVKTSSTSTIATATDMMVFTFSGAKFFKARISAYTSGTITVQGYASQLPYVQIDDMYAAGSVDTNSASTRMPLVSNYNLLFDGTNWIRQRSASASADGATAGAAMNAMYGFAGTSFDRQRVGKTYKWIEFLTLANNTATTIWTPTAGRRFRLMGVQISTSAAATVHLRDGAGGTRFHSQRTGGADTKDFNFGNGYLSAAANNVLEILNSTGSSIDVWVTAWGTEE